MLHDILVALWFPMPAAFANMAPVFAAAIPVLKKFDTPMDFGATFRGRRLFGPHKTWRGMFSGILLATVVLWIQQMIAVQMNWNLPVDYVELPVLLLGPLFAIGALGGDAIESFFKRQRGIPAGGTWIPFDQVDFIIGSLLLSLFFVVLTPMQYVWIFAIWFGAHLCTTYVGYKLGLKKSPI